MELRLYEGCGGLIHDPVTTERLLPQLCGLRGCSSTVTYRTVVPYHFTLLETSSKVFFPQVPYGMPSLFQPMLCLQKNARGFPTMRRMQLFNHLPCTVPGRQGHDCGTFSVQSYDALHRQTIEGTSHISFGTNRLVSIRECVTVREILGEKKPVRAWVEMRRLFTSFSKALLSAKSFHIVLPHIRGRKKNSDSCVRDQ